MTTNPAIDRIHMPVPATPQMPAGRLIAIAVDPGGRPWEVVLHEAEAQYTVRTPPGFDGVDETAGLMFRTDYATVGYLTIEHGLRVPTYVTKAIADGRVSKGWEPGTHLFCKLANVDWALPVHTFVEKLVADDFNAIDGAESKVVEGGKKPWWQRAADKLGAVVKRRPTKATCPLCEREVELKGDILPYHDSTPPARALCNASLLTIEAATKLKEQP